MLAPERMKRVTVIGPNTVMERVVRELHRLKAVHITDHQKGEFDIGSPMEKAERISEILVTVRAVSSALGISGKKELSNGFRAVGLKNLAELEKAAKKLNDEVAGIQNSSREADDELKRLAVLQSQLEGAGRLGLKPSAFADYKSLACFFGKVKDAAGLRKSLLAVTDRFELFSSEGKGGSLVAVFVDSARKQEAMEALAAFGFSEVPLSELKATPGMDSDAIAKRREKLLKQLEAGQKAAERLSGKWNDFLLLSEQLLEAELEKAEAPLRFGVSRSAFILSGWVPASMLGSLEESLSKATGERIFVEASNPSHGEAVPVKMDNPQPARPFEFFMRLYALPRYDEIDPTVFTFLTFPLFFGFILGDVGYGLVTFFLLLWLKEKIPGSAQLVNVILPASVSSIAFGFIFGEVFGFEHAFGYEFPHLLGRAHDINLLIVISVVIGLLHINLGFVLGFLNELRHKGFFRAFSAKLTWILLEISIALGVLSYMGMLKLPIFIPAAIAVVCVALITKAEGFRGPIEIPGLMSNLLSYSRLAAVGLSSVILAVVVNDLAKQMAHAGPVGMVAAIIILFIGHTINLMLGIIGGFLHSLRLHYVEFFTKFFEGGAVPFSPFGSK